MDDDSLKDILNSPILNRLWLFAYLIPVFGMVPAVWTLLQHKGDRRYRAVSRLALGMGGAWLVGCVMFSSAFAATSESGAGTQISLLLINSLFTSGYFVLSLGLMTRLLKRNAAEDLNKSIKLLTKPSR
jgi:hypothetical protein